jgi:hypothetical protein
LKLELLLSSRSLRDILCDALRLDLNFPRGSNSLVRITSYLFVISCGRLRSLKPHLAAIPLGPSRENVWIRNAAEDNLLIPFHLSRRHLISIIIVYKFKPELLDHYGRIRSLHI